MKFNYFNQSKGGFGIAKIGRAITFGLSRLLPRTTTKLGNKIFLKPTGRRHYQFEDVKPDREINVATSLGNVHVNLFGHGKSVVIVSHGWADSSICFQEIIKSLVKQGYLVAAIDNIGHGKSYGNKAHLLGFIESLEQVLEHMEQERLSIDGIIGHSMGALATLNLASEQLNNTKVILISLPVKFFDLMFSKVEQFGISRKLLIRVLENISKQYGRQWQQLNLDNHRVKLNLDVTFIHDEKDRYAPFVDLKNYLSGEKTSLITTSGLGHTRILGDTGVINSVSQVLAS